MEKDFLQNIKIEISRNFNLVPYERIAFDRLLGIIKSENGMKILNKEIEKAQEVREYAISILKEFENPVVLQKFLELLKQSELSNREILHILDHVFCYGSAEHAGAILDYLEGSKGQVIDTQIAAKVFQILKAHGKDNEKVFEYLKALSLDKETPEILKCLAIEALSSFHDITFYEDILKEQNENTTYSVYRSLAIMSERIIAEAEKRKTDEDINYTYSPELEDKFILNIRVLLGKMTSKFDTYSNKVKTSFLDAMIRSNHREFIIYTMKALTTKDQQLLDMVLHLIYSDVDKLRDPDKLFRNLLALSVSTKRENEIIINIFEAYFNNLRESRKNNLFRDKLYNYIVVTLETYFETYRKEFMVTEVIEKDFPEDFRLTRRFILEHTTPEIKKKLVYYLRNGDRTMLGRILSDISEELPYLYGEDKKIYRYLLEILFDNDQKSRDNSAQRFEDINFEKRYLKNRIVRITEIIGRLRIDEAASALVKIFNYVKKYPDEVIFEASVKSLSMLNYSYMQGELELLIGSGDRQDQETAIRLLSLYSDQRSINILLDFAKDNIEGDLELLKTVLNILIRYDILGNASANSILKHIIEKCQDPAVQSLAILCIGKCGMEEDIEFLKSFFESVNENEVKEAIILSMGFIINFNSSINRRQIIKYVMEYLKDPAIKVRIYSCALLIQLGNKDALKSIRDMMIIKNKYIQREILGILGRQKSVEFSYFLISLLKEEYAISSDILPTINLLPREELVEIDHFIVNIFKKYEGVDLLEDETRDTPQDITQAESEPAFSNVMVSFLNIVIFDHEKIMEGISLMELIILNKIYSDIIYKPVLDNNGIIHKIIGKEVSCYFFEPSKATETALQIRQSVDAINSMRLPADWMRVSIQVFTDEVDIANEEIMFFPVNKIAAMNSLSLPNRIIIDEITQELTKQSFHSESFPDTISSYESQSFSFSELLSPVNTDSISKTIIEELEEKEQEKLKAKEKLESDIKKLKREQKTSNALQYAQAMDEIGKVLKDELDEIVKYVEKRSTDRELINKVNTMVSNVNKRYLVETTKMIME